MQLRADDLTIERGGRTVIAGLSFVAPGGEALVLTGPNGAGKTTLLRTIAGLMAPVSGRLRIEAGTGVSGDEDGIGPRCHLVGHLDAVKSSLTVAENARFWARFLGGPAGNDHVMAALERFHLADLAGIRAGYLSAGQRRRLGLVRLLLAPRELWLLDEPAVSLDAASQELLAQAVNAHLAAGGITVAATHQPLGLSPQRELRLAPGGAAP